MIYTKRKEEFFYLSELRSLFGLFFFLSFGILIFLLNEKSGIEFMREKNSISRIDF